ncbi:cytochrome c oxidase subunit 6B1-like [Ambystoma mexicanum]|uniref:Cytochrome c oxidase subunit 6B1 n=1 Tax=Ailuropoda melanoleuca TaxID=9646 RepID=A0A7N5JAL3_AILME|nr:cytochrome c oxidase subunit 6B1-like [Ailuropoda melanoleuca]
MADEMRNKIDNFRTAPFDARFPNINQSRNCYQNYRDYHRCLTAMNGKGADPYPCEWYHKVYKCLCPVSWVAKWDEERELGTFAGKV